MMKRYLTLLSVSVAFSASVPAQCVLEPIRVERVEGYLLFGFQGHYRVPDKAEVRLLDSGNTQRVIASVPVDKDGHFGLTDAKPGRYVLSARSDGLIPASVDVEVTKAKGAGSKRLILALLAADATKECGGASIKVQRKAEIDRALSTAKRSAH